MPATGDPSNANGYAQAHAPQTLRWRLTALAHEWRKRISGWHYRQSIVVWVEDVATQPKYNS